MRDVDMNQAMNFQPTSLTLLAFKNFAAGSSQATQSYTKYWI